jgi:hypothetical protein
MKLGVIKKSSPGLVPWNSLLLPLKERSLANLHNALITTTYFMPPCAHIPQNKDKPAAAERARENACENKTQKPHAAKFTSAKSTGGAHFLSKMNCWQMRKHDDAASCARHKGPKLLAPSCEELSSRRSAISASLNMHIKSFSHKSANFIH